MKHLLLLIVVVLLAVGIPQLALAGMPSITLSDFAKTRLESISFFLCIIFLITYIIKRMWNFFRKDFPNLPELNFKKSLGLVLLWGLAFHLVLSMITGTREIMTPNAWEREGVTYRLKDKTKKDETGDEIVLGKMCRDSYSQNHEGKFPPDLQVKEIPNETWKVLEQSDLRYRYIKGLKADVGHKPLVYEPGIYGEHRYVLFTNGKIQRMDIESIYQIMNSKHN